MLFSLCCFCSTAAGGNAVAIAASVSFAIIRDSCAARVFTRAVSLVLFSVFPSIVFSRSLWYTDIHSAIYIYNLYGRCKSNHSIECTHTHSALSICHTVCNIHFVCLSLTDAHIFSSFAPSLGSIESHTHTQSYPFEPTPSQYTQTDLNVFKTVISELIICRWYKYTHTYSVCCVCARENCCYSYTPCTKAKWLGPWIWYQSKWMRPK